MCFGLRRWPRRRYQVIVLKEMPRPSRVRLVGISNITVMRKRIGELEEEVIHLKDDNQKLVRGIGVCSLTPDCPAGQV